MKILKSVFVMTFAFLFLAQAVQANQKSETEISLGENLVRQLWVDMKTKNIESLEKKIASGFQSIHQDGARNREQELSLIKELNLGEYILSDFKITRNGAVIIVTYFVSVAETIEGKLLSKKPAPRLSIFLKTESGWQWIAHANLKSLER